MTDPLRIELDRADRTYAAGDVVRGRVVFDPPSPTGCRSIVLRRSWRTAGKGNPDEGESLEIALTGAPLEGPGPHVLPFEVATPPGPFTYDGHHLAIDHYLEAVADVPVAIDPGVEEAFVLVPGPDVGPPHPDLYRSGDASDPGLPVGCRRTLGSILLLMGLLTLPFGLVLLGAGAFILVPDLWRRIAGFGVGDVEAHLDRRLISPGGSAALAVRIRPAQDDRRINDVTAVLRCKEVCVSDHGRSRSIHTHVVLERSMGLSGPRALVKGERVELAGEVEVPEGAPYTFSGDDNQVVWEVDVRVDIPSWPDWRKVIPVVVWPEPRPRRVEAAPARPAATLAAAEDPVGPRAGTIAIGSEAPPAVVEEPTTAQLPPPIAEEPAPAEDPPAPPARSLPAASPEAELVAAVRRVVDAGPTGGAHRARVQALVGTRHTFELRVHRVERSFGVWSDPVFRDGRTITGTVGETDVEVAVRFPATANDEVDALGRGDRLTIRGTVLEWEGLRRRAVVGAEP